MTTWRRPGAEAGARGAGSATLVVEANASSAVRRSPTRSARDQEVDVRKSKACRARSVFDHEPALAYNQIQKEVDMRQPSGMIVVVYQRYVGVKRSCVGVMTKAKGKKMNRKRLFGTAAKAEGWYERPGDQDRDEESGGQGCRGRPEKKHDTFVWEVVVVMKENKASGCLDPNAESVDVIDVEE